MPRIYNDRGVPYTNQTRIRAKTVTCKKNSDCNGFDKQSGSYAILYLGDNNVPRSLYWEFIWHVVTLFSL